MNCQNPNRPFYVNEFRMDEQKQRILESFGWTPELLEIAKRGNTLSDVDRKLLDDTKDALIAAGFGALDYLAANPAVSKSEVVERLRRAVFKLEQGDRL